MIMNFLEKYEKYRELVEKTLEKYFPDVESYEKKLHDSMRYSVMAGGKRFRPVLSLAVCDMLGGKLDDVLPFACALEMIHTYSLVHDDLPAMDNDDYRRGVPTNHKVYGEAMAILSGDSLLTYAVEIMTEYILDNAVDRNADCKSMLKAMSVIVKASGHDGMVGGQAIDLESEGIEIPEEILRYMHSKKTGALIKAAVMAPFFISDGIKEEGEKLLDYSLNIGLAFQIKDDILDVEGNSKKMGKNIGSDKASKKSTFVSIYGLEESKKMLEFITKKALESIEPFGERALFLKELSNYLMQRDM
jgi:geranylgeranyl diphosphate synthase, type II